MNTREEWVDMRVPQGIRAVERCLRALNKNNPELHKKARQKNLPCAENRLSQKSNLLATIVDVQ